MTINAVDVSMTVGSGHGFEGYCPLYLSGVTQKHVADFWDSMPWNLELPMNPDGSTSWGNCDICYKKSLSKRASIIRDRPDLAEFWIKAERDKGQFFRPDQPSYKQMRDNANSQRDLFVVGGNDETIPCFCGD